MGRRWLGSVKYRAARRSYLWSDGMASATATRSEHRMASRSVRLSGIDAPKRKQHFGAEAKKAVADRVPALARLDRLTTDRYGRSEMG